MWLFSVLAIALAVGCSEIKISCKDLPDPRREIVVLPVRVEVTPTPSPAPCIQYEYH